MKIAQILVAMLEPDGPQKQLADEGQKQIQDSY